MPLNSDKVYLLMQTYLEIPQPLSVMGISVTPFDSYKHAVECILHRIAIGQKTFCLAMNPEKVYVALNDLNLKTIFNKADIQICDGIGVKYAARLLLGQRLKRCTGVQLFFDLIANAAEDDFKVFLLGATLESNKLACSNLLDMYPDLKIVGHQHGYFQNSSAVVKQINESEAELLFVAMGSPKQELWLAEHKSEINAYFCMGVGGTFDLISGKAKRAPKFFRKTGTEFFYRLLTNTKRWRRQLVLPKFGLMVLKEKFFHPNSRYPY